MRMKIFLFQKKKEEKSLPSLSASDIEAI